MRRLIWSLLLALLLTPAAARAQSEEVVYYHTDAIGSVRMITDANGDVVARYDFLPFGVRWGVAPPAADARMFAGKERDPETELDYFGARYYSDQVGRFTTVDPVMNIEAALTDPQRWNRYSYAVSRPLKFVDPDGRDPRLVGGAIGAAVYAGWTAYTNSQAGRPWHQNIGVGASKGFLVGVTIGMAAPILASTNAAMASLGSGTATIAGPLGMIARSELDDAMNAGGRTIDLVTKLTQAPSASRALSVAAGEGAHALASASRTTGDLYMAKIPEQAIKMFERAGLLTVRTTMMNGVRGTEYRLRPESMEYLAQHFEKITK